MNAKASTCHGCQDNADRLNRPEQPALRRVLWAVLLINLSLFVGEFSAGWLAASTALQADSLDALGDAGVYALSLLVVGRSLRWRAGAALVKGVVQGVFGLMVAVEVIRRWFGDSTPAAPLMVITACVAMLLNLSCFLLLNRFRHHDINMRSVWLCSRNDVLSNLGVIVAAGAVAWWQSSIPDLVVGGLIASLFLHTSWSVLHDAWRDWRLPEQPCASATDAGTP
ncbi:cation transporter [Pseudomarimonas arenosa]|uniref:Cation transporter n=1 Tax=Pseudomarimonas arenosa TaxID=2774145 RepID=A0AAW3ZL57_9GAMM|nr:cation transporter [Pseudomarimonas arenosa]MBD8525655.1 cation transporter [Pseudomarimonas arenosa]